MKFNIVLALIICFIFVPVIIYCGKIVIDYNNKQHKQKKPLEVSFYNRDNKWVKNFRDFNELEEYLYKKSGFGEVLPECKFLVLDNEDCLRLTQLHSWLYITMISDPRGILYSDGSKTTTVKHCSEEIREWVHDVQNRYEDNVKTSRIAYLIE